MDVTNGGRGAADFMLGLEARAASLEEPDLNTAISAACDAYGTDMGRGGEYARQAERMWCDAAAYDWLALCDDPRAVGGWADDTRRLAVVAAVLGMASMGPMHSTMAHMSTAEGSRPIRSVMPSGLPRRRMAKVASSARPISAR